MEELNNSLQENIIILLTFNTEASKIIFNTIKPELFGNTYYRNIASKAISYIASFNEAPKEHIADLLEYELNNEKTKDIYTQILQSIYENKDSVNKEYIIDALEKFIRQQNLKIAVRDAVEALQRNDFDNVEFILDKARKKNQTLFDPGVFIFNDVENTLSPIYKEDEDVILTGIKELDRMEICPAPKELFTLVARAGAGKAQSLGSRLYTPTGFKLMKDACVNDIIFNSKGKPTKILQTFPQGKKGMYKVSFVDDSFTKTTEDHLWESWIAGKGQRKIRTTGEIKQLIELKNKHILIPLADAVQFEERNVKIHPYVLGVILADGGLTKKTDVTITKKEKEVLDRVERFLPENTKLSKRKTPDTYGITKINGGINPILVSLRQYGLLETACEDKHIPEDYLYNSIENRTELLKGLLDTDGYIDSKGGVSYSSKSETLINDITFLVQSLGGTATKRPKKVAIKDKDDNIKYIRTYYNLYIRIKETFKYFSLTRKLERSKPYNGGVSELARRIKSIEYVGEEEAQCIMIEDENGLYLTDNFIVTHNTWFLIHLGKMALLQRKKILHISLELSEERLKARYLQALFGVALRYEDIQNQNAFFKTDRFGCFNDVDFRDIKNLKTFKDKDINVYLRNELDKVSIPKRMVIREFPTGSLTINQLVTYLDNLESFYNFIPDIILLDYLDLMSIDADKLRVDLGKTAVDLRGIAVERNLAMVTVAQTNRAGEGRQVLTRKHLAEDFSKVRISDNLITYNQVVDLEQEKGYARLFVDKARNTRTGDIVLISQNYSIGQFCLNSCHLDSKGDKYWSMVEGK